MFLGKASTGKFGQGYKHTNAKFVSRISLVLSYLIAPITRINQSSLMAATLDTSRVVTRKRFDLTPQLRKWAAKLRITC